VHSCSHDVLSLDLIDTPDTLPPLHPTSSPVSAASGYLLGLLVPETSLALMPVLIEPQSRLLKRTVELPGQFRLPGPAAASGTLMETSDNCQVNISRTPRRKSLCGELPEASLAWHLPVHGCRSPLRHAGPLRSVYGYGKGSLARLLCPFFASTCWVPHHCRVHSHVCVAMKLRYRTHPVFGGTGCVCTAWRPIPSDIAQS
jgi:hypothetical protein